MAAAAKKNGGVCSLAVLIIAIAITVAAALSSVAMAAVEASTAQPSNNNNDNNNNVDVGSYGGRQGSLRPAQCLPQCTRRCSQTQYHKPCMFFCQKCCNKCLCVPPGFYGNKSVCPCYNNWKTQQGGPKCP